MLCEGTDQTHAVVCQVDGQAKRMGSPQLRNTTSELAASQQASSMYSSHGGEIRTLEEAWQDPDWQQCAQLAHPTAPAQGRATVKFPRHQVRQPAACWLSHCLATSAQI